MPMHPPSRGIRTGEVVPPDVHDRPFGHLRTTAMCSKTGRVPSPAGFAVHLRRSARMLAVAVRSTGLAGVTEDGPCLTAWSTRSAPAQPDSSDGGQGLSTVTHGQPARRRRRSDGSVVNTTASWTSAAWAATMASMPLGVRRAPDRSTPNRSWPARRAVA